jgi:hypothetical protein
MALEAVVRDSCKRHAYVVAHRFGGEHDVEFAREQARVVVERLVEVADAEE